MERMATRVPIRYSDNWHWTRKNQYEPVTHNWRRQQTDIVKLNKTMHIRLDKVTNRCYRSLSPPTITTCSSTRRWWWNGVTDSLHCKQKQTMSPKRKEGEGQQVRTAQINRRTTQNPHEGLKLQRDSLWQRQSGETARRNRKNDLEPCASRQLENIYFEKKQQDENQ